MRNLYVNMSLAYLAILTFVYISCSLVSAGEYFTIKRNNLFVFRDRFQVPVTQRVPSTNFCNKFRAEKYYKGRTDCWCPQVNATFGYYNNEWTCFGNSNLRTQHACSVQLISTKPSHREDALYIVASYRRSSKPREYTVNLTDGDPSCQVDMAALTYQKCGGGQWQPFSPSNNNARFSLQYYSNKIYKLKVSPATKDTEVLDGSVIKLVINCASPSRVHCLLIKLKGAVKCSTKPPVIVTTTTSLSSAIPTPSSAPVPLTTTTIQTSAAVVTTAIPGGRDNSNMDGEDKSNVPTIVGAAVAGLLVVIVAVVVVLVILRRMKKKRAYTSANTKPITGVCYEIPNQNGTTTRDDGDYVYEDPSTVMGTNPHAPEIVYMEAFQKPFDKEKVAASPEGAIYDQPLLGPTSESSRRATSEYEPLRHVAGTALEVAGNSEQDARQQSVYEVLHRPGDDEQEPLYQALA